MAVSVKDIMLSHALSAVAPCLAFGFTLGQTTSALDELKSLEIISTTTAIALFGSIVNIGALLGCFIGGAMANSIGRQQGIMFLFLPFISGFLIISFSTNASFIIFARFMLGISCGMSTTIPPMYICEVAPKEKRGYYGTFVQLAIVIGIFIANSLPLLLPYHILTSLYSMFCMFGFVLAMKLPESPVYLVSSGDSVAAMKVLASVRAGDRVSAYAVDQEVRDIQQSIQSSKANAANASIGIQDLFKQKPLRKPFLIGVFIMVAQQLTCINVIIMYSNDIFTAGSSSGVSGSHGNLQTAILGLTQVFGTIVATNFVERCGRRQLLCSSLCGIAVCCFGLSFWAAQMSSSTAGGYFGALLLSLYILSFAFGAGPIPMLVVAELQPSSSRAMAQSCCLATNWSCSFLVTLLFPILMQHLDGQQSLMALFGMAGTFCAVDAFVIRKIVPETNGKSAKEIELMFSGTATKFSDIPIDLTVRVTNSKESDRLMQE